VESLPFVVALLGCLAWIGQMVSGRLEYLGKIELGVTSELIGRLKLAKRSPFADGIARRAHSVER
jgi:hypothetical protein